MKLEIAQYIAEGRFDISVVENYSGRGNFDKKTPAIRGKTLKIVFSAIVEAAFELGKQQGHHECSEEAANDDLIPDFEINTDEFLNEVRNLRTDNLGHDTVVY